MLAMHPLLVVWFLPLHQISAMIHSQAGLKHSPSLNSKPANSALALQTNAAASRISFSHNASYPVISSISSQKQRGTLLLQKVAGCREPQNNAETANDEQQQQQERNISNASEANANAANGGEQAAYQQMEKSQQQKCHDLATEPIADIKSTVDSLMTKLPGHGSRDYTSEQLTKALEHTNRILGHHLSMCIFKHILEERREQMEQAQKDELKPGSRLQGRQWHHESQPATDLTVKSSSRLQGRQWHHENQPATDSKLANKAGDGNHVQATILLNHTSLYHLKSVVFDILDIGAQAECTEEFCDVEGGHMPAPVEELLTQTNAELEKASQFLAQENGAQAEAVKAKVDRAIEWHTEAKQIFNDIDE